MERCLRLLIVEDEGTLRRSLCLFFRRRGYEVSEASSLEEAEVRLAEGPFAAALIDVCLPDGSGLSLLGRFGAGRAIAMSANPASIAFPDPATWPRLQKPLDLVETERLVAQLAAA